MNFTAKALGHSNATASETVIYETVAFSVGHAPEMQLKQSHKCILAENRQNSNVKRL